MGEFDPVEPQEIGWNRELFDDFVDWCEQAGTRQLMVVHQGKVVAEQYWHGATVDTRSDIYSAQKGVVGLAVGSLIADGLVDLDTAASQWLGAGWTSTGSANETRITLRHLLNMTSGLRDDFSFDAEPGTTWYYNNNGYHQVRKIVERVTGKSTAEALQDTVYGPAAMSETDWRPRPDVTDPTGWPIAGMFSTARDLMRFGRHVLALRTTAPAAGLPEPDLLRPFLSESLSPATSLNPSYGLLWWLLDGETAVVPDAANATDSLKAFGGRSVEHRLAPSAPPGTVAAMGAGDQRLYLVPDHDLLLVRLGKPVGRRTAAASNVDEAIWKRLAPALG